MPLGLACVNWFVFYKPLIVPQGTLFSGHCTIPHNIIVYTHWIYVIGRIQIKLILNLKEKVL